MPAEALPALPGSSLDGGSGPVCPPLVQGLFEDAAAVRSAGRDALTPAQALSGHREHLSAWYADLVGGVRCPAASVPELVQALSKPDHALRLILTADAAAMDPLADLRQGRDMLLDDHRVELTGVCCPLPPGVAPEAGARRVLELLDFTVPAWVEVGVVEGWPQALEVLAEDGVEHAALRLTDEQGSAVPDADLAALLRRVIDLELSFTVHDGPHEAVRGLDPLTGRPAHGLLNLLCAVRAALNGAVEPELARILAERSPAPLASAARRMSEADAAVARAFLASVAPADLGSVVQDLQSLGLLIAA